MSNDIAAQILEFIKINRVSTTEVADAFHKTGLLDGKLKILNQGTRAVGFVHYVPAVNGSNWHTHKYISNTPKDSIVFVDADNTCEHKAIFGSLVAKYIMLYCQSNGIIVSGKLRDVHTLVKEKYAIWCYGSTPIGCTNDEVEFDEKSFEEKRKTYEGAIIVADDSGVVIIKKEQMTLETLERLKFIENQEDIWLDCIDRLKWNTFETVCLKKYKTERQEL